MRAKLRDFKTWADEGPPQGHALQLSAARGPRCFHRLPALTNIATQTYSQATMTKIIARCAQQGKSIDRAIAWASDELEGFMRG
jgi:hypothetical protein